MQRIIQGFAEYLRSISEHTAVSNSTYLDESDRILYCTGINYAPLNGILEKNNYHPISELQISQTIDAFKAKKLPFCWWTANSILEKKGLHFSGNMKGILLDITHSIPRAPINVSELIIKPVRTDDDVYTFTKTLVEGARLKPDIAESFYQVNLHAFKKELQLHFIAYVNEMPVSTATLSLTPSIAGIWNCATLPEYRRRGIATMLGSVILAEARKRRYREVFAILLPKMLSKGMFVQLGFREICDLPFFVHGMRPSDIEK